MTKVNDLDTEQGKGNRNNLVERNNSIHVLC